MPDLIQLHPRDEYNIELERSVHPADWQNPTPDGRYHLVVIGAGTAGLVTAAGAAGMGAKVALIERELMGGDCLNVGCVPSKAIISAARVAATVRDAGAFGINVTANAQVDFAEVMKRMRRLRAKISPHDSAKRFSELGIDVYFGQGTFLNDSEIDVAGQTLRFKKAVIATGGRAAAPSIDGLNDVEYLTNENLFSLTELPPRFGIIGGGPIGAEIAQSFARFGSQVHLFTSPRGLMPNDDRDAAQVVQREMERDGIQFYDTSRRLSLKNSGNGIRLQADGEGGHDVEVDKILVAAGRAPNVEKLGLEIVGVHVDDIGIQVNDRLQTTNRRIYAAGDVCSQFKFTHAADFMARIVIQNALFMGRARVSALTIPHATYTSPEVAQVGLTEAQAEKQSIPVDVYVQELSHVDRAMLEGEDQGFVKVLCKKRKDKILGATIVATNAGDLISEITVAIKNGVGLSGIGSTIHPYPTQAEAIRRLGDQYNRTRLTPFVKSLFHRWLAWTR